MKKGAMPKETETLWSSIKEWHVIQHERDIKAAFELGDMILNAEINAGLDEYNTIKRIIDYLGELAYSVGTYWRTARLARTFNAAQRMVLVKSGISVERAAVLSSKEYDGKRRIKIIARIKTGELKKWTSIKGTREETNLRKTATLREGIKHPDDMIVIQVRDHGAFQRSLMSPGLESLFSQVDENIIVEMSNLAITRLAKMGRDVKPLRT